MRRGYTFYSRSAGVEVMLAERQKRGLKVGAVRLRFFPLESGSKNIVVWLTPEEALKLSRMIFFARGTSSASSYRALYHTAGEHHTSVSVDVFVRDGKRGLGLTAVRRGGREEWKILVALTEEQAELMHLLLRELAVAACYEYEEDRRGVLEDYFDEGSYFSFRGGGAR
ncbi:MAG: hypothetical protein QXI60_06570 [Thermofilaceae archaeon]